MSSANFRRSNSLSHIPRPSGGGESESGRPRSRSKISIRTSNVPKKRSLSSSSVIRKSGTISTSRDTRLLSSTPSTYTTPQSQIYKQRLFGSGASTNRSRTPQSGVIKKGAKWTDKKCSQSHHAKIAIFIQTSGVFNLELANAGNIKPPSINTFIYVTTVLLEDISLTKITKQNYITELPNVLKKLSYPSNLPASSLKIVSSMHAWPQVMSMWSYLVDMVDDSVMGTDTTDSNIDQLLIGYSFDSYINFNENDGVVDDSIHDRCTEELEKLLDINRDDFAAVQKTIDHNAALVRNFDENLRALRKEAASIQERLDHCDNNRHKEDEELCNEEHSTKEEIAFIEAQLKKIREEIAAHKHAYDELLSKTKSQQYDAAHKEKLQNAIELLTRKLAEMEEQYKDCCDCQDEKLQTVEELSEQVKSVIHQWNTAIRLKYNSKNAQDCKTKLTIPMDKFKENSFLTEVKNVLDFVVVRNAEWQEYGKKLQDEIKEMESKSIKIYENLDKLDQECELNANKIKEVELQRKGYHDNISQCVTTLNEKTACLSDFVNENNENFILKKKELTELDKLFKSRKEELDAIAIYAYKIFHQFSKSVNKTIVQSEAMHEEILMCDINRLKAIINQLDVELEKIKP